MGIWRTFPNSVTTEVDASLFMPLEAILPSATPPRKGAPMEGIRQTTLSEQAVDAIVRSTERLEGAASILSMLEDKASSKPVSASEIAAVRCVVESCAADLDAAWAGV